jgi:crossover junction endodeoxyribonuclease RusA
MIQSPVIIELPWTAAPLSLNDRGAWAARARKIADVRATMLTLARAAKLPHLVDHATIQLHYRPRDRRRRDTDNLVATLKPICDALTIGRAAGKTRTGKIIPPQYGYGLVLDDIPRYMSKPEPIIHPAERGKPGAMWLEISWTEEE